MIAGIGIDAIDINRFSDWHNYPQKKLLRVFTPEEIVYCLTVPAKTAERFAARFAAKEAFYKAFSSTEPQHNVPFLTLCKAIRIHSSGSGKPELRVAWQILNTTPLKSFISLTHTPTTATAIVILENS